MTDVKGPLDGSINDNGGIIIGKKAGKGKKSHIWGGRVHRLSRRFVTAASKRSDIGCIEVRGGEYCGGGPKGMLLK